MSQRVPGRAHRKGLLVIELMELFPDEEAASTWFESVLWPDGRRCGHCGSVSTRGVPKRKPMPYWCSDCRSYFSVKTGTAMQRSKIPLRKWAIAIYLCLTSLKTVSSMKLRRDLKVTQKTAWFMLHRIRKAWIHNAYHDDHPLSGPIEAAATHIGGMEKNKHLSQNRSEGRGPVEKMAVAGFKDRATRNGRAAVAPDTTRPTLCGFVASNATPKAMA